MLLTIMFGETSSHLTMKRLNLHFSVHQFWDLRSPDHDSYSVTSIETIPMSLLIHFSLDIPVLACESYAFHQENIQYTDVIRNPYQKNPIASIMVTLAGKSSTQN